MIRIHSDDWCCTWEKKKNNCVAFLLLQNWKGDCKKSVCGLQSQYLNRCQHLIKQPEQIFTTTGSQHHRQWQKINLTKKKKIDSKFIRLIAEWIMRSLDQITICSQHCVLICLLKYRNNATQLDAMSTRKQKTEYFQLKLSSYCKSSAHFLYLYTVCLC